MHKYDPEWDEINKYHAALKSKEDSEKNVTFVIKADRPEIEEVK